jgi:hypothetical protein
MLSGHLNVEPCYTPNVTVVIRGVPCLLGVGQWIPIRAFNALVTLNNDNQGFSNLGTLPSSLDMIVPENPPQGRDYGESDRGRWTGEGRNLGLGSLKLGKARLEMPLTDMN